MRRALPRSSAGPRTPKAHGCRGARACSTELPDHARSPRPARTRGIAREGCPGPIATIAARGDALLEIDPDIRVRRTLPARVYSDPEIFRLQRDRLFARTWHYAGHDDLVKVAGQVHPFTLLPGALDEPLLLTRDQKDQLHCMSNVCTHRGTVVVEGPGHEQQLRCRYHGRRFTLDGRFHSMPEFEATANFPSAADDLPAVSLERLERFLMVALAPAMPFDDVATPVRSRLAGLPFADLVFDPSGARDYLVE